VRFFQKAAQQKNIPCIHRKPKELPAHLEITDKGKPLADLYKDNRSTPRKKPFIFLIDTNCENI
jgi:hypothetical protein